MSFDPTFKIDNKVGYVAYEGVWTYHGWPDVRWSSELLSGHIPHQFALTTVTTSRQVYFAASDRVYKAAFKLLFFETPLVQSA